MPRLIDVPRDLSGQPVEIRHTAGGLIVQCGTASLPALPYGDAMALALRIADEAERYARCVR